MTDATPELPRAKIVRERARTLPWVVPIATLALLGWLAATVLSDRGPRVVVRFERGHGVEEGAEVRHRGIAVGRVEDVRLGPDREHVLVALRLDRDGASLATDGARLWVERPQLSAAGVSGLDTLLGARYLALDPGPADAPERSYFVGLEAPPVAPPAPGELELVLEAPRRAGIAAGAPVLHRQLEVGRVLSIALASDAGSVELRVAIRADYAPLVRDESVFWNASGTAFQLSLLEGLRFELDSLESVLVGGVAFATPPDAGGPVRTGRRFALRDAPPEDWLDWKPNLPVGAALLPTGSRAPRPERATLEWRSDRLFVERRTRSGWLLAHEAGWLGPAELLGVPDDAKSDSAELEVAGLALAPTAAAGGRSVAVLAADTGDDAWPRLRCRALEDAEACLLFGDAALGPLALDAARLAPDGRGGLSVASELALDEAWHGAPVVARADGALVGVLLADEDGARIAPLPPAVLP